MSRRSPSCGVIWSARANRLVSRRRTGDFSVCFVCRFRGEIVVDQPEVVLHIGRIVEDIAEVVPENLLRFERRSINLSHPLSDLGLRCRRLSPRICSIRPSGFSEPDWNIFITVEVEYMAGAF